MVVTEKCMNGRANDEEPEHRQVAPKATPQTFVLMIAPSITVDET